MTIPLMRPLRARFVAFRNWITHSVRYQVAGVFVAIFVGTVAVMVVSLILHKQSVQDNYLRRVDVRYRSLDDFFSNKTAQAALRNLRYSGRERSSRPYVLNVSAVAVDDARRANDTTTQSGCPFKYHDDNAEVCFGIGNQITAGAYLFVTGFFTAPGVIQHIQGNPIQSATNMRLRIVARGTTQSWVIVFQDDPRRPNKKTSKHWQYRITGYRLSGDETLPKRATDDKELIGVVVSPERSENCSSDSCTGKWTYSYRVPIDAFRDDAAAENGDWPPKDIGSVDVRLTVQPPGDDPNPLFFDSNDFGASRKFSLDEKLDWYVERNEVLKIVEKGVPVSPVLWESATTPDRNSDYSPFFVWLTHLLPGRLDPKLIGVHEIQGIPGRLEVRLTPDSTALDGYMVPVVQQYFYMAIFVCCIMSFGYWLIDYQIIRRINRLTRHARDVSASLQHVKENDAPLHDFARLGGNDEFGVLGATLDEVLGRLGKEYGARREGLLQFQRQLRAIGHEIYSPIQALEALVETTHPARRHVNRMMAAVGNFQGAPSVREADLRRNIKLKVLDVAEFLKIMCENTSEIEKIQCKYYGPSNGVRIHADEVHLESALDSVLQNAKRFSPEGEPIDVSLKETTEGLVLINVINYGPPIEIDPIDRVFEFGVTEDQSDAEHSEHSGQGLYVANQYVAGMGGTITPRNLQDRGVAFEFSFSKIK